MDDGHQPLTTTAFETVVSVLHNVGDDPTSLERIAFSSTFAQGESAWVAEAAWQAARKGLNVRREAAVGGVSRVDLEINGTAVEFKATFGAWALASNKTDERARWLGGDVDKLRRGTAPAVAVVSVAALGPGVTHQQQGFKVEGGHAHHLGHDASGLLAVGLDAAEQVLQAKGCRQTERLTFPVTFVRGGEVHLAVVVAAVNESARLPRT